MKRRRLDFTDLPTWKNHVEQTHIMPIAWKLGDGPAGGLSDMSDISDAYLSDRQGRRVTPRVVAPPPDDNSQQPQQPVAGRGRGRGAGAAGSKAAESLRLLEMKKKQVGFGLDKGGATLANEKRRQGFIDDDDLEEVVPDSD